MNSSEFRSVITDAVENAIDSLIKKSRGGFHPFAGFTPDPFDTDDPWEAGMRGGKPQPRCVFELQVPAKELEGMSRGEIRDFLMGEGCDVLLDAWRGAGDVKAELMRSARGATRGTRGGSVSASCTASSGGGASCTGSVSYSW